MLSEVQVSAHAITTDTCFYKYRNGNNCKHLTLIPMQPFSKDIEKREISHSRVCSTGSCSYAFETSAYQHCFCMCKGKQKQLESTCQPHVFAIRVHTVKPIHDIRPNIRSRAEDLHPCFPWIVFLTPLQINTQMLFYHSNHERSGFKNQLLIFIRLLLKILQQCMTG